MQYRPTGSSRGRAFPDYPPVIWILLPGAGILIGVLAGLLSVGGGVIAVPLHLRSCSLVMFAGIAVALAVKMAIGERLAFTGAPLKGLLGQLSPAIVGALASAVGMGGGTLSSPVLSLFSFPIKPAIGAGALFNLVIALPAAGSFLTHDHGTPGRSMRWATWRCFAWRRCRCLRSLSRRWRRAGRRALRSRCCADCSPLALPSSPSACSFGRELGAWAKRRIRVYLAVVPVRGFGPNIRQKTGFALGRHR
jgi:hypothetical protein